jgi:hypothetical protein
MGAKGIYFTEKRAKYSENLKDYKTELSFFFFIQFKKTPISRTAKRSQESVIPETHQGFWVIQAVACFITISSKLT